MTAVATFSGSRVSARRAGVGPPDRVVAIAQWSAIRRRASSLLESCISRPGGRPVPADVEPRWSTASYRGRSGSPASPRDGLSNRETGAQLFISGLTGEWNLRMMFAKLGISSRMQLPAALSEKAGPSRAPSVKPGHRPGSYPGARNSAQCDADAHRRTRRLPIARPRHQTASPRCPTNVRSWRPSSRSEDTDSAWSWSTTRLRRPRRSSAAFPKVPLT